eukprot:Colp12_sorted_trinity150504_noHs@22432
MAVRTHVLLVLCMLLGFTHATYTVNVKHDSPDPVIGNGGYGIKVANSKYAFNFNVATLQMPDTSLALVVRVQDRVDVNGTWNLTPSKLALTRQIPGGGASFASISDESIIFEPEVPEEGHGTEDPHLAFYQQTGLYYLLYTANDGQTTRLCLATSPTPWIKKSWTRHGPVFKELAASRGGALLLRDAPPHYLYYSESNDDEGLKVAQTMDLQSFVPLKGIFLPKREGSFDALKIESGPAPLLLSDGNYLMIYNSARKGVPSTVLSGYDVQYNAGFVILNGTDPSQILQRSESPILSPTAPWEIGNVPSGHVLVPDSVFVEGAVAVGSDQFRIFYGAAETFVGIADVVVTRN